MAKKIPQKINKAIKEYVKAIEKDIPVKKVILYGSYAKGRARKTSDIDLAIISDKFGKNPSEEGKYLFRKLWEVKESNIDPVGYSSKDLKNPNPSPLLYEIKQYGQEVVSHN